MSSVARLVVIELFAASGLQCFSFSSWTCGIKAANADGHAALSCNRQVRRCQLASQSARSQTVPLVQPMAEYKVVQFSVGSTARCVRIAVHYKV